MDLKAAPCKRCGNTVMTIGSFVKDKGGLWHITCYLEEPLRVAFDNGRREAETLRKMEQEIQEEAARLAAQQKAEQERAKKLAEQNLKLEQERIKTLAQQEMERIKKAGQGEAKDRFSLIEIDD